MTRVGWKGLFAREPEAEIGIPVAAREKKKAVRPRCPECGASYSPNGGGHCRGGKYGGCCRTFTSDSSGDKHRVGPYDPPGSRRCLTLDELLADGWRETPHGWTPEPPMSEEQRARMRARTGRS
jgi:hypothetical protein